MVANKHKATKRKIPDVDDAVKVSTANGKQQTKLKEPVDDESASDYYESDEENLFANIDNGNDEDSTDSEGEGEESDDEEVQEFESADSDFEDESGKDDEEEAEDEEDDADEEDADSADDVNSDSSPEPEEEESDDELEFEEDLEEPEQPKAIQKVIVGRQKKSVEATAEDEDEEDDEETRDLLEAAQKEDEKLGEIDAALGIAPAKTRGVGIFPPEAKSRFKGGKNQDEYAAGDTSDEEDIRNTVGNIPMHWYDEYKHIGYDWEGNRLIKPAKTDAIDDFLKKMEDPNFWRTVKDPQTGQNVVLTDEDIGLIKRIMAGKNPDEQYSDYEPWIEWFTSEVEKMPIRNIPDHKRSFLPSKSEKQKVGRLVHALKMGWIKTRAETERLAALSKGPKFYMIWESDHGKEEMRRIHDHVVAPKRPLPGHAESYNPPPEYLFNEQELSEWNSH